MNWIRSAPLWKARAASITRQDSRWTKPITHSKRWPEFPLRPTATRSRGSPGSRSVARVDSEPEPFDDDSPVADDQARLEQHLARDQRVALVNHQVGLKADANRSGPCFDPERARSVLRRGRDRLQWAHPGQFAVEGDLVRDANAPRVVAVVVCPIRGSRDGHPERMCPANRSLQRGEHVWCAQLQDD